MEHSGFIVLTLVSLVSASPYGYGAKSAAVAKAEASAGAAAFDALPLIPAHLSNAPGFSGSFSKSSSSSFASSSASSSSSSFSFTGAGSHVVPCLSGGCEGQNKLDSNIQHSNNNGILGNGFNNAAAGAKATAGVYTPNNNNGLNEPCVGSNCYNYGGLGKDCLSGSCGPIESTPGNPSTKCTSSPCGKESYAGSYGNFQTGFDKLTNDNNVNILNKPQQPPHSNEKPFLDGQSSPTKTQTQFDLASGSNFNSNGVKSSECVTPDCDLFVPHAPVNKPSTHLETPYQEKACATHDCVETSNLHSEPGKLPSSYNVPILGDNNRNIHKQQPNCLNGNCQLFKSENKINIQLDTVHNPRQPVGSECLSGNCATPSLTPTRTGLDAVPCTSENCPKTTDSGLSCVSGLCGSPSINAPNTQVISSLQPPNPSNSDTYVSKQPDSLTSPKSNLLPFQPNSPTGPYTNPLLHSYNLPKPNSPYQPNSPTGPTVMSSIQPFATIGPKSITQLQPNAPTGPDANIPYNSYTPYSNIPNIPKIQIANPSNQPEAELHPSYQPHVPNKSDGSCLSGDCLKNILLNPHNIQISNSKNPTLSDSVLKTSFRPSSQTVGNQPDCASSSCSYPNYSEQSYINGSPKNSQTVNFKPHDSAFDSPPKSPTTDSKVLLYNKGNQIYSGGLDGPVGLFSTNKKQSDTSILVNPPQSDAGAYRPHYFTNEQPKPYVQDGQHPSRTYSSPTISGNDETQKHLEQSSADSHSHSQPSKNVFSGVPNGYPISKFPNSDKEKPYTGGFGGPAGLLKPNEHTLQPNGQKPECASSNCGENLHSSPSHGAVAVANAEAVAYSGGFGGPPGLLKPYDSGKIEGTVQQNFPGKHSNAQNVGFSTVNNGLQSQNFNGALSGAHATAVASASTTATDGGVNHSGGCNTGCANKNSGAKDGLNQGEQGAANASASARSIAGAGSYAQAGSVASTSAHASAGASVNGGYKWR